MSVRHVARRVALSLAATAAVGAFATIAFVAPTAVPAGATTACSLPGDECLTAAQPVGTVTAHTPFSSGQVINVVVPANQTFSSTDGLGNNTAAINILECAAPNGVIPTLTTACDGNTIQGPTVTANTDGSFTLTGRAVAGRGCGWTGLRQHAGDRMHPLHREQPGQLHRSARVVAAVLDQP
jgi:hypothetical protein